MHKTMSERPGVGGYFTKSFGGKFCKKEGSIRTKTNERGGQLDQKLRRKLMQNAKIFMRNP